MKLENYNEKKKTPTATDTIKEQREEITLLKAKLAEQTKLVADLMKADEAEQKSRHTASIRTGFVMPTDWTDLEKLWLAFKVMDFEGLQRHDTFDDRDDIFYNVWKLLLQAVIIAPTRTHEDIMIKLEAMDYFTKWHIKGADGNICFNDVAGLEIEATAINRQLTDCLEKILLPEQKEFNEWREKRNATFKKNCANLTDDERQQITDSCEGKGTLRVEDLYNERN